MILLALHGRGALGGDIFAVFGTGLVGTAVVEALTVSMSCQRRTIPIDWQDAAVRREQVRRVEEEIIDRASVRQEGCGARRLVIVWSAGKAGFGATARDADSELSSFEDVLAMAGRLAGRWNGGAVVFVMMSSAGWLFEGQRSVGLESSPSPRRPYGRLKLQQERMLEAASGPIVPRIYRLTSVYGYLAPGRRRGLLSTLIINGIRRQVTHFTGEMDTLRDFIWADDIGQFVVRDLAALPADRSPAPLLLASTRPSAIREIHRIAEQVVCRRIYVSFESGGANSANITFSPRAVAAGWQSSDLTCNARRIYLRALSSGAAFELPAA